LRAPAIFGPLGEADRIHVSMRKSLRCFNLPRHRGEARMDVDSLKTELEKQLARNPDPDAPHGFRGRFESAAEQYHSDADQIPKAAREAELQRICAEAEAAANAAGLTEAAPAAPAQRVQVETRPEPKVRPAAADPVQVEAAPLVNPPTEGGGPVRYGVAILIAAVAFAGAYYFFRR
jgi:hypothetical protein